MLLIILMLIRIVVEGFVDRGKLQVSRCLLQVFLGIYLTLSFRGANIRAYARYI